MAASLLLTSCINSSPKLSGRYESILLSDDEKISVEFLENNRVHITYEEIYDGTVDDRESTTTAYTLSEHEDGFTRVTIEGISQLDEGLSNPLVLAQEGDHLIVVSNVGRALVMKSVDAE